MGLRGTNFSQCPTLSALTGHDGTISCARRDLDRVARRNDWGHEFIDNPEMTPDHGLLTESGTVVIWAEMTVSSSMVTVGTTSIFHFLAVPPEAGIPKEGARVSSVPTRKPKSGLLTAHQVHILGEGG